MFSLYSCRCLFSSAVVHVYNSFFFFAVRVVLCICCYGNGLCASIKKKRFTNLCVCFRAEQQYLFKAEEIYCIFLMRLTAGAILLCSVHKTFAIVFFSYRVHVYFQVSSLHFWMTRPPWKKSVSTNIPSFFLCTMPMFANTLLLSVAICRYIRSRSVVTKLSSRSNCMQNKWQNLHQLCFAPQPFDWQTWPLFSSSEISISQTLVTHRIKFGCCYCCCRPL